MYRKFIKRKVKKCIYQSGTDANEPFGRTVNQNVTGNKN